MDAQAIVVNVKDLIEKHSVEENGIYADFR